MPAAAGKPGRVASTAERGAIMTFVAAMAETAGPRGKENLVGKLDPKL